MGFLWPAEILGDGNLPLNIISPALLVPPGGTAQIVLNLDSPAPLILGQLTVDLDASVFSGMTSCTVFSAAGDQYGTVQIQGLHAQINFQSNSGGIGRLPDLPIVEITAPLLASAAIGAVSSVDIEATSAPWRDINGQLYSPVIVKPVVTVGSGVSITAVTPGGGVVPGGSTIRVTGTGFVAGSTLQVPGVAYTNVQVVSPQEIDFTLAGQVEFTGRHFKVVNPNGSTADYFSDLTKSSVVDTSSTFSGQEPIFPTYPYAFAIGTSNFALENQNAVPVDVLLESSYITTNKAGVQTSVTIPPFSLFLFPSPGFPPANAPPVSPPSVYPSSPVRGVGTQGPLLSAQNFILPPAANFLNAGINSLQWSSQSGAQPSSQSILVNSDPTLPSIPFTVSIATDDGNPWLTSSESQGMSCASTCVGSSTVSFSFDGSNLMAGTHTAVIQLQPGVPNVFSFQINVQTTVSNGPIILTVPALVGIQWDTNMTGPNASSIKVQSNGASANVSVSSAASPPGWFVVTPQSGVTPFTINIKVPDAPSTALSSTPPTGTITLSGPSNSIQIPIGFDQSVGLNFSAETGVTPPYQAIDLPASYNPPNFSVTAASGGTWLSGVPAGLSVNGATSILDVYVNPSGLAPGTYNGSVTITPPASAGIAQSFIYPISLTIWNQNSTPPITVSPAQISFSSTTPAPSLSISTGGSHVPFAVTSTASWLDLSNVGMSSGITPAQFGVEANSAAVLPGVYQGAIIVASPPGSLNTVTVPVIYTAEAVPPPQVSPWINAIANAASLRSGALAPGEIVSLFGIKVGTPSPSALNFTYNGNVGTAPFGQRVLFNGIAAPVLYSSATQTNVVVPSEIAGSSTVTIEIDGNGELSPQWTVPVVSSSPAIFTQAGTGVGSAAVLNQDGTYNSSANPAAAGSIIQIFATGAGAMTPSATTGSVTTSSPAQPILPVTVIIGGQPAMVESATAAPGEVAGVIQVNCTIPMELSVGAQSVILKVGSASSPSGIVVWVH